jgi:hypothetical protein
LVRNGDPDSLAMMNTAAEALEVKEKVFHTRIHHAALMLLYLSVEYCAIIHVPLVGFLAVLILTTFFAHLSFH